MENSLVLSSSIYTEMWELLFIVITAALLIYMIYTITNLTGFVIEVSRGFLNKHSFLRERN